MGMLRYRTVLTLLVLLATVAGHPAGAAEQAITRGQIEADWLRQDLVRNSGPSGR